MFKRYLPAPLVALLLLATTPRLTQAQTTGGVGIGTIAPDASAALDIVSSTKGALLPRLTQAQVVAIASPATGLLVFQTDGLAGFYYNAGTPAAPAWQQLTTATGAALTFSNGLTQTGSAVGLGGTLTKATTLGLAGYPLGLAGGSVQLSATSPVSLGISNTSSSLNLGLAANGGEYSSLAQPGDAVLRTNGKQLILAGRDGGSVLVSTGPTGGEAERLRILPGGNVGIGTATPGQLLDVAGNANVSGNATVGGNSYVGGRVGIGTTTPGAGLHVRTDEKTSISNTTGIFLSGGASGNPNIELRGTNGAAYLDFANDLTADYTARILSNSTGLGFYTALTGDPMLFLNGGSVGVGTTAPDASAVLDLTSTSQGLLPPRLTEAQRDAIQGPAVGLTLYNTTTGKLNSWDGVRWTASLSATEQSFQYGPATFGFTGRPQTYKVPIGVSSITVVALGASGGRAINHYYMGGSYGAGGGARVQATLAVTGGEVLTINVGGQGGTSSLTSTAAGYNGGGGGGYNKASDYSGGGGGGQSDIQRSGSYILVAGGGGGGGYYGNGGGGGAPDGQSGESSNPSISITPGAGGTQSAPGSLGGAAGKGGDSPINSQGGGGGAGYFGGGGGRAAGGGGGSSWVTPTGSSSIAMQANVNPGNPYQMADGSITITPGLAYAAPVLDGRNFVNVPGDNLGNHIATQNLNLAGNQLVGNGGTAGLAIGSTGNVGIGTTSPGQKLDVAGSATVSGSSTVGGLLTAGSATVSGNAVVAGTLGLGTTAVAPATQKLDVRGNLRLGADGGNSATGTGQTVEFVGPGFNTDPVGLYRVNPASDQSELRVVVGDGADNNDKFVVGRTSASAEGGIPTSTFTPNFTVTSAGNVGIGTSTPGQKLDVTGNVNVSGNSSVGGLLTAGSATVSGNVGIGTSTPGQKLDVAGNANVSGNSSVGGLLTAGSATVSGNVGIGTSTPGQKLDVAGNANVSGNAVVAGTLGIGTTAPAGGLHVTSGNGGPGTGAATAGVVMGGAAGQPAYLELRGSGTGSSTSTPYIDFAETNDQDYATRLISVGGTLTVNGSNALLLKVNGSVQATNVTYTSDARFKQHVRPLSGALSSVLALRGLRYEWNALGVQHGGTAGASQVGLLAQEVEKIYPELVSTDKDGYKAVNYAQLTPVLLEAIKELAAQNEALKAQNAALKAETTATLETFEARLRRLEAGTVQAQR